MRRTLISLNEKASRWTELAQTGEGLLSQETEGMHAYAASQASVYKDLANHFEDLWQSINFEDQDDDLEDGEGVEEHVNEDSENDEDIEEFYEPDF